MDGLAPRTRRPDRSMVSFVPARPSERHVPGTGPVRLPERSSHARALPALDDASLTLGRRIGVLVVLAALAGAIVLAASGGGGDRAPGIAALPTSAVVATAPSVTDPAGRIGAPQSAPAGRPSFVVPGSTLVRTRRVDLRVRVPEPGVAWDGLELRVLRGGSEVLVRAITPADVDSKGRVTLKGVRLKRGSNKLTVLLANPGGAGPASDTLTMRLDDQPPRLAITAPRAGATLNHDSVTVRGRTVPGLRVIVRNVTTNQKEVVVADGEGRFEADLGLKRGRATIKVAVADAAGNQNVERFPIIRGDGRAEARLSLSRESFRRSALPRTFDATVSVLDADGRPIKGARVVLTFGPPGLPAQVREMTTSRRGTATWSDLRIAEDAVVGEGLVAARVTLPDDRVLTDTRTFRVK